MKTATVGYWKRLKKGNIETVLLTRNKSPVYQVFGEKCLIERVLTKLNIANEKENIRFEFQYNPDAFVMILRFHLILAR